MRFARKEGGSRGLFQGAGGSNSLLLLEAGTRGGRLGFDVVSRSGSQVLFGEGLVGSCF